MKVSALATLVLVAGWTRAVSQEATPSLYDRLGGLAPISVVVSDVTALVCQVTGGPCEYHGRGMKESHAHLNITEAEWDRMVAIFLEVLARHGVPERETGELVEIVGSTKADIVAPGAG